MVWDQARVGVEGRKGRWPFTTQQSSNSDTAPADDPDEGGKGGGGQQEPQKTWSLSVSYRADPRPGTQEEGRVRTERKSRF